jgi:hypothetical protein
MAEWAAKWGTYILELQTVWAPKDNNHGHFDWEQQNEYTKSVTETLMLVQGVCYLRNKKVLNLFKKEKGKEVYVQSISSIFLELGYILRIACDCYDGIRCLYECATKGRMAIA